MSPHLTSLAVAAALCTTLASCSKDDSGPDNRIAYRRALTSGKWQITRFMRYVRADENRHDTLNELKRMGDCVADDVYTFTTADSAAAGILLIDEGLTKCDSTLPQQRPSQQWIIPHPEARSLMISEGKSDRIYALEKLQDGELHLRRSESYLHETGKVESQELVFTKMP